MDRPDTHDFLDPPLHNKPFGQKSDLVNVNSEYGVRRFHRNQRSFIARVTSRIHKKHKFIPPVSKPYPQTATFDSWFRVCVR